MSRCGGESTVLIFLNPSAPKRKRPRLRKKESPIHTQKYYYYYIYK
jgi:hypothetical protein